MVFSALSAQNTVCFEIESNPNSNAPGLGEFTKYVNVLDVMSIYAESSISDAKVLHAAAVVAELLDNDEDGKPDNPKVLATMIKRDAFLAMTENERALVAEYYQRGRLQHHRACRL